MGDLFKALSSGLARFVYAWLLPSIITTGVFVFIVLPELTEGDSFSWLGGIAVFTLSVVGLSVIFAYASRPIYQFLEGHTMPRWLAKLLTRRSRRRYLTLLAIERLGPQLLSQRAAENLKAFPESLDLVMPTRLGNALKAMETYGETRFGLDSQTFWYELHAVAAEKVSRATEEARAAVDFFMSSVAHLALLVGVCSVALVFADDRLPVIVVIVGAAALIPLSYLQAVRNVGEWRWAVQALVNTSRPALAQALSLSMPESYLAERKMWENISGLVHYGPSDNYLRVLDPWRARSGRDLSPESSQVLGGDSAAGSGP